MSGRCRLHSIAGSGPAISYATSSPVVVTCPTRRTDQNPCQQARPPWCGSIPAATLWLQALGMHCMPCLAETKTTTNTTKLPLANYGALTSTTRRVRAWMIQHHAGAKVGWQAPRAAAWPRLGAAGACARTDTHYCSAQPTAAAAATPARARLCSGYYRPAYTRLARMRTRPLAQTNPTAGPQTQLLAIAAMTSLLRNIWKASSKSSEWRQWWWELYMGRLGARRAGIGFSMWRRWADEGIEDSIGPPLGPRHGAICPEMLISFLVGSGSLGPLATVSREARPSPTR